MLNRLTGAAALLAATILPAAAFAQAAAAPAPAAPAAGSSAVANPTYVTIPMEIAVDQPAAEVWKRVGKYCDIAEWLQIAAGCKITAGADGKIGAVRTIGGEVLVGRTELSYTYTQTVRDGRLYNLYHGTLEARPVTAKTSKLVYTLIYDNSMVPGDAAAKQAEVDRRRSIFMRAMNNMKTLAEGGTLPPPPAPPARPPG